MSTEATTLGGDPAALTPAQATERLAELQKDPEWSAKVTSTTDGAAEKGEFHRLMEARAADSGKNEVDQLIAGNVEIPIIDTRYNGDLTLYKKQLLVEDLRQIGISDGSLRYLLEEESADAATWQAVEELRAQLLGDPEFIKNYLAGGREERKKMALIAIVRSGGKKAA